MGETSGGRSIGPRETAGPPVLLALSLPLTVSLPSSGPCATTPRLRLRAPTSRRRFRCRHRPRGASHAETLWLVLGRAPTLRARGPPLPCDESPLHYISRSCARARALLRGWTTARHQGGGGKTRVRGGGREVGDGSVGARTPQPAGSRALPARDMRRADGAGERTTIGKPQKTDESHGPLRAQPGLRRRAPPLPLVQTTNGS